MKMHHSLATITYSFISIIALCCWLPGTCLAAAAVQEQLEVDEAPGSLGDIPESEFFEFNDEPLDYDLLLPDWFKLSFLELKNDLQDAKQAHKTGLIVYFGQKDCPYCRAHLEHNWHDPYIVAYTRKHFDVTAIDVRGDRPVADINGKIYRSEKEFAIAEKANFTPTLIFYDTNGKEMLRLSGYHPPYQFKAALEYVVDDYYKTESLKSYFARASQFSEYGNEMLNPSDIFSSPPYALDRTIFPSAMPLAVFFEKTYCHACDILHSGPLENSTILQTMEQLESVQLDIRADTPVLTPDGKKTTAKQWAEDLGLYYTPTIIFFDEHGKEIIRVDSVVGFYRLNNVLHYVLTKGYLEEPNFQLWRQRHRR
jgi:thioredoxin-related protein